MVPGGGVLDLAVTEVNGSFAYLGVLEIALADEVPTFVLQPQSIEVAPGTSTSMAACATNSQPLNYQWYFQNSPIPGAISTNLPLPNVATRMLAATSWWPPIVGRCNQFGGHCDHWAAACATFIGAPIDFSRNDGLQGDDTTSPDANGNGHWNNIATTTGTVPQGLSITNLVTVNNDATTLGLNNSHGQFRKQREKQWRVAEPPLRLAGRFCHRNRD